jgi:DNA-binding NarL/FixJ family response regulator
MRTFSLRKKFARSTLYLSSVVRNFQGCEFMRSSVRIVIVEDEVMIRSILRLFCEREPLWHVVGEAGDCETACSVVEAMRPDIVLLDLALGMENGLDCLPHLLKLGAGRVVVLTGNEDPAAHARALELGAAMVLRKGDAPDIILGAIQKQAAAIFEERRRAVLSKHAGTSNGVGHHDDAAGDGESDAVLDERERRIIELLAAGHKDAEIAAQLRLSPSALEYSLSAIYRKLGVEGRVELVVHAFRHHLVVP